MSFAAIIWLCASLLVAILGTAVLLFVILVATEWGVFSPDTAESLIKAIVTAIVAPIFYIFVLPVELGIDW